MDAASIDLRSDAVTHPTEEMREAMKRARVGAYLDDEDPTVSELERLGATRFGKQAALFLPSATMANLISCMYYCKPGEQVLLDEDAHVHLNEVNGMTRLASVPPRVVRRAGAAPDLAALEKVLSHRGAGEAPVSLLWVENTRNAGGVQSQTA